MEEVIVDLHTHSQMKAYAHCFTAKGPTRPNADDPLRKNSVWRTDWPTAGDIRKNVHGLFGLTHFTQADMVTCLRGNVQVTFSSLYPLEKGFTYPFNSNGKLADTIINCVTQFGKPRINFTQGTKDYFPDLVNEYEFQQAQAGIVKEIMGRKYRYQFVNSYDELELLINQSPADVRDMALINSIEGAHCFGTGLPPYDLPKKLPLIKNRIRKVKTEWKYPPFFITLAHHFYNEICGHAKSLGPAGKLLNQRKGMNTGFTEEGEQILRLLLDDTVGPRVLIDIKHMSLASRKRYYQILQREYGFSVPIIVSHGCVTGYHNRIDRKNQPSTLPGAPHKKFCRDDINFYDFEIVNIKNSEGIFGIQLSENRIGSKPERLKAKRAEPRKILFHSAKLVWNQIQHIAEVLDHHGHFAWGLQSIGSDFDGIIDPIDGFFTTMHYENLSYFLLMHAHNYVTREMPHRIKHDFNRIDPEEIVDRFMRENAVDFLRRNFRKKHIPVPVMATT